MSRKPSESRTALVQNVQWRRGCSDCQCSSPHRFGLHAGRGLHAAKLRMPARNGLFACKDWRAKFRVGQKRQKRGQEKTQSRKLTKHKFQACKPWQKTCMGSRLVFSQQEPFINSCTAIDTTNLRTASSVALDVHDTCLPAV